MASGKVKWFNLWKGYGFIVQEDGREFFFQRSDILGSGILEPDDPVSFEIEDSPDGPHAKEVKKMEPVLNGKPA